MSKKRDEMERGMDWDGFVEGMPVFAKELIAGGVAGGVAKTVVAPLERIKILFQDYAIKMASSSSGGDLRYRSKFCRCGEKAAIRVTDSDRQNNKGKLYFVCKSGACNLWEWCNPTVATIMSTSTPSVNRNVEHTPSIVDRVWREELNGRVKVVEASQGMMKLVVVTSFILAVVAIVIGVCAFIFK